MQDLDEKNQKCWHNLFFTDKDCCLHDSANVNSGELAKSQDGVRRYKNYGSKMGKMKLQKCDFW